MNWTEPDKHTLSDQDWLNKNYVNRPMKDRWNNHFNMRQVLLLIFCMSGILSGLETLDKDDENRLDSL